MFYPEDIREKGSMGEELMPTVYSVISAFTAANTTEKETTPPKTLQNPTGNQSPPKENSLKKQS